VLGSLWNCRNNDGVWVSRAIVGEAKMGGLGISLFLLQFYTSNVTPSPVKQRKTHKQLLLLSFFVRFDSFFLSILILLQVVVAKRRN